MFKKKINNKALFQSVSLYLPTNLNQRNHDMVFFPTNFYCTSMYLIVLIIYYLNNFLFKYLYYF